MSEDLSGRAAVVTGGARGLGEATARALAGRGMRVVIADVREELAASVAASIRSQGGSCEAVALDLTDAGAVDGVLRELHSRLGGIDAVVNSAGVDLTVPITDMPVEQWDHILAVNLRAPFVVARTVLPLMAGRGGGHIINIASTAAKRAWPNASAYHASKWGLLGFTYALHCEARAANVRVTAVVAGGMRTPFLLERFPDIDVSTLQDPANVARAVVFALTQPPGTVIPEVMVLPLKETSWP